LSNYSSLNSMSFFLDRNNQLVSLPTINS